MWCVRIRIGLHEQLRPKRLARQLPPGFVSYFLMLGALLAISSAHAADWEGKKIVKVSHQTATSGERQLTDSELADALTIRVGDVYNSRKISESIERLFLTGRYVDIRATADAEVDGVALTFVTTGQYFVGSVNVRGVKAPPTETQLRVATRLELGAPIAEGTLEAAGDGMKRLLADQGYFQPKITWAESRNPESQQSSIEFTVASGERARLGAVSFEGTPVFPPARLLDKADWHEGDHVNAAFLQNGLSRLRDMYRGENYLQAKVELTQRNYHADSNRLDWVITVTPGLLVDITIKGAQLSRAKLKELVPVFQEGSLDEDLLREGARNLATHFESNGYFDVAVGAVTTQIAANRVVIEYQVNLGERHRLNDIRISGNRYFRNAAILDQIQIETPRRLTRFGRFSRQMLDSDVERIRTLYVENGFAQVKVEGSLEEGVQQDIQVVIKIEEGPQTLIGDFSIAGTKAFSEDTLRALINADTGQPYSDSMVTSDGNTILTFYLNEGYPSARFRHEAAPAGSEMLLRYIVDEGLPSYISNIFVGDLKYTRRGVVNRQIQFAPGEPISQGRLLDTQRRLYDLGIFSRVDIGVQNPQVPARSKNVLLYMEEARRYTLRIGLGAELGRFGGSGEAGQTEFSPDVSIAVSRINFWGRPHTFGLRARFSALQKRGGLNYTAPRLFNLPWLTGTLLAFYDQTNDVKTFTARRWEASLQFEARRSRITTIVSRYSFRRVSVDENSLRISGDQIPLLSQPVLVGLLGVTWLRDTRDSPGKPRQGNFQSVDAAIAAKQLGSEASFVRGLLQHSSYMSIPGNFTFVRATQFGIQAPFGRLRTFVIPGTEMTEGERQLSTRAIPISERFFSGGGSSHRGFGLNQAGPRDPVTGFALGGNALFVNTLELRHAVWDSLIGVLFHDVGNVFASVEDFSFKFKQDSPTDFNFLTHALGIGLRYETPVAPIRFDVGYTVNSTRYQVVTNDVAETRRLSRWQFLFSVGQTF